MHKKRNEDAKVGDGAAVYKCVGKGTDRKLDKIYRKTKLLSMPAKTAPVQR